MTGQSLEHSALENVVPESDLMRLYAAQVANEPERAHETRMSACREVIELHHHKKLHTTRLNNRIKAQRRRDRLRIEEPEKYAELLKRQNEMVRALRAKRRAENPPKPKKETSMPTLKNTIAGQLTTKAPRRANKPKAVLVATKPVKQPKIKDEPQLEPRRWRALPEKPRHNSTTGAVRVPFVPQVFSSPETLLASLKSRGIELRVEWVNEEGKSVKRFWASGYLTDKEWSAARRWMPQLEALL